MGSIPFIAIWKGFDLVSNLLIDGIPFLAGLCIARKAGKKAFKALLIASFVLALLFTVLYQFRLIVHAFDWLGLFAGAPLTYLFFGLIAGRILTNHKEANK